eukprot:TRINITY_DN20775_c0_g1_i1.p1 TRINITY_DN20775_c0_g1~~TRINITY_DN20775_c0_g1_i1.p1  ORF type:complete len:237 (+),score=24.52 TRINITY_DN20775_c0_g1_i1:130-840(+)
MRASEALPVLSPTSEEPMCEAVAFSLADDLLRAGDDWTCSAGELLVSAETHVIDDFMRFCGYISPIDPIDTQGLQLTDTACFTVVGVIVFLVLSFCWHKMRALFGYMRLLFVDRLCTSEQDEAELLMLSHRTCVASQSGVIAKQVEPRLLGRASVDASAVSCLRRTALQKQPSRNEADESDVLPTGAASQDQLQADASIPFDGSWRPVTEASSLSALGPVYLVDLGQGEVGTVIRL